MGFCYICISLELYEMPILLKKTNKTDKRIELTENSVEMETLQTEVTNSNQKIHKSPKKVKKSFLVRSHSDDEAMRRQVPIQILNNNKLNY